MEKKFCLCSIIYPHKHLETKVWRGISLQKVIVLLSKDKREDHSYDEVKFKTSGGIRQISTTAKMTFYSPLIDTSSPIFAKAENHLFPLPWPIIPLMHLCVRWQKELWYGANIYFSRKRYSDGGSVL